MDPRGPKHYIFGDHFYSKNARKLRFHVFLHFDAGKNYNFTWSGLNSQETVNFVPIVGPRGPELNWIKSCEFDPLQVKW